MDELVNASPVSSRYSSCGESEFERYCSANSLMGTPMCSSFNTTFNESADLDNFSLDGSVRVKIESNLYDNDEDSSTLEASNGTSRDLDRSGLLGFGNFCDTDQERFIPNAAENVSDILMSHDANLHSHGNSYMENGDRDMYNSRSNGGSETGRLSEEEEILSRCGLSEDEDSLNDYGTDNDHNIDMCNNKNVQHHGEDKKEDGSSLLMNSSTAFGSDDWDDFEQEMGSSNLAPLTAYKIEEDKQMQNSFEKNLQMSSPATSIELPGVGGIEQGEEINNVSVGNVGFHVSDKPTDHLESCSDSSVYQTDSHVQRDPFSISLNALSDGIKTEHQCRISGKVIAALNDKKFLQSEAVEKSKYNSDPLSDTTTSHLCSPSPDDPLETEEEAFEGKKTYAIPSMFGNKTKRMAYDSSCSVDIFEDQSASIKMKNVYSNESYDDVVSDMEEILLESVDSSGVEFFQNIPNFQSHLPDPSRDGGSTASTSGTDDAFSLIHRAQRIDEIEVIGAKQKKGDVSLGERLVGVKEYTVYIIKVWSGKDQWEVERRYRDFSTLFRRLKSFFTDQGLSLPSPWSSVERESRKIFGNASPDVVAERSSLIQECLRSILHSNVLSTPPSAVLLFLSPLNSFPSSPSSSTQSSWSTFLRREDTRNISTLGKSISLIVEIRPYKSTRQLLEAQNYSCAGCHRHFDDGNTMMQNFVHSLGWGKPRLCEYTGQLFCASCHTNETAILPVAVLHHWDFTYYPVSQMAKSYLDSIRDQPMLCVSAVNPFLFSKVLGMLNIMNVRKKVGSMHPYVRCPFRRSINKALGTRKYLLESNDFFALRDLIDLSKGAFAALPVMLETVSRKILEHITEQCLICCDVGVPCDARQGCIDPSSLIFPFQESEVEKCKSCRSVYHRHCSKNISYCHCGLQFKAAEPKNRAIGSVGDEEGALDLMRRTLGSRIHVGFLSGLFASSKQENHQGNIDGDTIISMGALPNTSL